VWAPLAEAVTLHIISPAERKLAMEKNDFGHFSITLQDVTPGTRYFYILGDGTDLPDPASHYQPEGVHGPSEVVFHDQFAWEDQHWSGYPLRELIIYELHTGTFTDEGTFDGIISRLDDLAEMGINAIEVMPVAQFPGNRNWGYDGVFPYAAQNSYGGPEGLKRLVNACHLKGISVILDVVYNHLGPEGNYFGHYGHYFTDAYHVPWGDAINYDHEWSDGVREYFLNNISHWFENYHIDGLRLDAIHTIFDSSGTHILEAFNVRADNLRKKLGRPLFLIAESDLNDPKVVRHPKSGGYGFDAQWLDDFHHALYVLIDPSGIQRYRDFGRMEQLAKAFTHGFVFSGEYVDFRKRRYGKSSAGISGDRFVVFINNHDQIGNRVRGERLAQLTDFERLKLGVAALLLSPYVPMLFMGEEYGEDVPFQYFISHSDTALIEAVREGRKKEFAEYKDNAEPEDAFAEKTFNDCKLKWSKRNDGRHNILLQWHKRLIALRRNHPILCNFEKASLQAFVINQQGIAVYRESPDGRESMYCVFNFSDQPIAWRLPKGNWHRLLDSSVFPGIDTGNVIPGDVSIAPASAAVYSTIRYPA
jgi:maltooligosyltrehalose trehalohydrolase